MDVIYRRGKATAAEVMDDLQDAPSYDATRMALRLLEKKGYLPHELDGQRYVYMPVTSRERARGSALRNVVRTFFDGSSVQVMSTLIKDTKPSPEELDRLAQLIEEARGQA